MSATAKVAAAAAIGAGAAFLVDGDFTARAFVRLIGNVVLSGATAVILMYFITSFGEAPIPVQWALAGIAGGLTMHITRRIKGADVSIKVGEMVSLTSEGIPEND